MLEVLWSTCKCSVWPLVASESYGSCGRCHERPVLSEINSKEGALAEFEAREGHLPEPIIDLGHAKRWSENESEV
jgi:hypothetical protein